MEAMRFVWERMKIVIEPSSATAFAPLLFDSARFKGLKVGVIASGGNLDLPRALTADDAAWDTRVSSSPA